MVSQDIMAKKQLNYNEPIQEANLEVTGHKKKSKLILDKNLSLRILVIILTVVLTTTSSVLNEVKLSINQAICA